MYSVEGKICGFKIPKTMLICFDKNQFNEINKKYFVTAVWKNDLDKGKDSIFALEVIKEGDKYILEIDGAEDLLKNYIGKRITVKFKDIDENKKGKKVTATEILFIE